MYYFDKYLAFISAYAVNISLLTRAYLRVNNMLYTLFRDPTK